MWSYHVQGHFKAKAICESELKCMDFYQEASVSLRLNIFLFLVLHKSLVK